MRSSSDPGRNTASARLRLSDPIAIAIAQISLMLVGTMIANQNSYALPQENRRMVATSETILRMDSSIKLPDPVRQRPTSLEDALNRRRSIRKYSSEPVKLGEVSQLLWAAQGITDPSGLRTAPSAGALYPLEVYLISSKVDGLGAGIYRYDPQRHSLTRIVGGDQRRALYDAALRQEAILDAPIVVLISGVYERTTKKYGERGRRYVHMEVGHAAQNLCLQATTLKLGSVVIGAFHDEEVKKVMRLQSEEVPFYIIPIGRK